MFCLINTKFMSGSLDVPLIIERLAALNTRQHILERIYTGVSISNTKISVILTSILVLLPSHSSKFGTV